MAEEHDKIETCGRIFVPWRWFALTMAGTILAALTVAAVASTTVARVEERTLENKDQIKRLEIRVDQKLDMVIRYMEKGCVR